MKNDTQSIVTLPIIRPTLPDFAEVGKMIHSSWESGTATIGSLVRKFEEEIAKHAGTRYAVALSSCTAGLMLIPKALGLRPGGEVIVPSFTFPATVQALVWNGLIPVFCDCLPGTCTLDPEDVERNLSPDTVAICAVSVYGLPPDIDALLNLGDQKGFPVYFDSAQGLGATYRGQSLGQFGACEVFSLSPTKVVTAIEGGLITTNDEALAKRIRSMRNYGKNPSGGQEMTYLGLSARMSELHASVGRLNLRRMNELIDARLSHIASYRSRIGSLPGCRVQDFPSDRTSNGNYFVLFITNQAKRSRSEVHDVLQDNGIQTKPYFYPPVHQQSLFQEFPMRTSSDLKHTLKASSEALALPLYSHMTTSQIDSVCRHIEILLA